MAGPGIAAGIKRESPVGLIDVYPTLLDLCGLPSNPANDGRSLRPLLAKGNSEWPHPTLSFWGFNNTAVAVGHHRYIRWEDGSEELYDIEADPNEWTNLANDEETSALRERLARHIPKDPAPWRSPVYNHNNYFRKTPSQRPAR